MELCNIRLRYVFKLFLRHAKLDHADQLPSCHLQALRVEVCSAISTLALSRAFEVRIYAGGLDGELKNQILSEAKKTHN